MTLTRRRLSRRTVLRGLGATVALPMLDVMAPFVGSVHAAVQGPRITRLAYLPS